MTEPLDPYADFPTREDVQELIAEVRRQGRFGKWNRRLIYVLAVFLAALLVLGLFVWAGREYDRCSQDRSQALSGPSADRVNLFFQAYTEAAGQIDHPLSDAERSKIVAGLLKERETFTVLPDGQKLDESTDFQLLAYRDLVAALHANEAYNEALADHPVCSFWGA